MQAGKIFDLDSGAGSDWIIGMSLRFAASGGSVAAPGDATDGLLVNLGANNDVTVSGTVAATQSGTWTVQPGNTANTTPWLASINEGGATAQVSAASGGALQVDIVSGGGSGGTASAFGDPFPAQGTAVGFQDSGGDMAPVELEADGSLPVTIVGGGGSGGTASADGTTFTADTTQGTPAMGVYESTPTTLTDGDLGVAGMTSGRRLKTSSTIDAALPAGTNAIGKLAANSGVDIGDVTVDNASGGAAVNIQDGGNTITVDGTVTVTDGSGALNVIVDSSALPSGAATAAKQPALGTAGSASTDVITVQGIAAMTPLLATVSDGSGALNVIVDSGTVTANAGTDLNTSLLALESGGNLATVVTNTGNTATSVGVLDDWDATAGADNVSNTLDGAVTYPRPSWYDGSTWDRARGDSTDGLLVNLGTNNDVTVTGTVSGTGTAGSAATGVLTVQGIASMTALTVSDGSGAMNVIVDSGTLTAVTSITNALPAGTNAIGKLAANSGVDIGDVDVTSEIPGTGATNLGKAEDAAHTSGDTGVAMLALQRNTPTSTAADNDYVPPITDTNQRLWVTGTGLTGSAVPPNATYIGGATDAGLAAGTAAVAGMIICQDSVAIDTASSGNVELVALTSSETIYVCGFDVVADAAVQVQLIYGTGTACATGETNLTGDWSLAANGGIVKQMVYGNAMKAAVSNALCIELSGAVQINGSLQYTKF